MSAAKKVIHGLKKAALFPIKQTIKDTKKATHFIKRYWKQIVIAAAIVFTAGIATVGIAGFSAAMGAAGGGFAGFMSAAGSTMVAGAAAIGGSVGIGSGVTASTAGGAFAAAPVVAGAGGAGLTLGTGAAAQGLGLAASTAATPAAAAAANAGAAVGGSMGGALGAGVAPGAAGAAGAATGAVSGGATGALAGAGTAGAALAANGSSGSGAAGGGTTTATGTTGTTAGETAGKKGLLDTILNSKGSGALISAGIQGINGYMQGKAQQDYIDQTKPLSYWGVGARGASNGGGAVTSPFAGGGTLFNQVAMTNTAPGATQPNNVISFQPSTPNGNQGLMAAGWDANLGAPVDENGNPITWN